MSAVFTCAAVPGEGTGGCGEEEAGPVAYPCAGSLLGDCAPPFGEGIFLLGL